MKEQREMWHAMEKEDVLRVLGVRAEGLTGVEVLRRQKEYGKNVLPAPKGNTWVKILLRQCTSPLFWVLGGAGILSMAPPLAKGGVGDWLEGASIGVVMVVNVLLGFVQEYRAYRTIGALRALVTHEATVRRDGKVVRILAEDLVVGDIMILTAGMRISADARVLRSISAATHEAILTGESRECEKHEGILHEHTRLSEQKNMLFAGTTVARGVVHAVVVATGARTAFGNIAQNAQAVQKKEAGFLHELRGVARTLAVGVAGIAVALFCIGILQGEDPAFMVRMSVALAVAAVPEGLLISATVASAVALARMAKRQALVRALPVAETLSAVDVVCVDKTGTLTTGIMEVVACDTAHPQRMRRALSALTAQSREHTSLAMSLTDQALARYAAKEEGGDVVVINALPFSSEQKYAAVVARDNDATSLYVLGAPDVLLSSLLLSDTAVQGLRARIQERVAEGLRVVLVCTRSVTSPEDMQVKDMEYVGIVALDDPLRADAHDMVRLVKAQNVRLLVLTGDHRDTAERIARAAGVMGECVSSEDIMRLSEGELAHRLRTIGVIARMIPEEKLRIVRALQADGHVVAMMGDGVNDAPALAVADVGIAPGSGTDVAKEAADMVLLDDRLATIASALAEGRGTWRSLQRITAYLLVLSLSEVALYACALFLSAPLPLSPLQVLWLNILVDGILALGLAAFVSPQARAHTHPRAKYAPLLSAQMWKLLAGGTAIVVIPLGALLATLAYRTLPLWQGIFFFALFFDAVAMLFLFARAKTVRAWAVLFGVSSMAGLFLVPPLTLSFFAVHVPTPSTLALLALLSLGKVGMIRLLWRAIL